MLPLLSKKHKTQWHSTTNIFSLRTCRSHLSWAGLGWVSRGQGPCFGLAWLGDCGIPPRPPGTRELAWVGPSGRGRGWMVACLLVSHRPKQITWPSAASGSGGRDGAGGWGLPSPGWNTVPCSVQGQEKGEALGFRYGLPLGTADYSGFRPL